MHLLTATPAFRLDRRRLLARRYPAGRPGGKLCQVVAAYQVRASWAI